MNKTELEWVETNKALAKEIIELKKAEPVKQEPVAWMNEKNGFICKEKTRSYHVPLYAAPVDAKAIRAEALEDAAKQLKESGLIGSNDCAAAIMGLK